MRRTWFATGVALATALVVALGLARAVTGAPQQNGAPKVDPAMARSPKNAAEFDELFNKLKNWGRWGKDDQIGALNLITPAKRKQALALAKTGQSVSMSHNLMKEPAADNPANNPSFEFTMGRTMTTDTLKFNYHGFSTSHVDTLCHFPYKDQTFNGYSTKEILSDKGCAKMGIETLKNGVITRGVLIDIPRLKGLPYLEPGTAVCTRNAPAHDDVVALSQRVLDDNVEVWEGI